MVEATFVVYPIGISHLGYPILDIADACAGEGSRRGTGSSAV